MIFLNKPLHAPQILRDNKDEWTQNLLDTIARYGSYTAIPKEVKESLLKYYRHQDIKDMLFPISHDKCAFCESFPAESGNIEVEHFYPKSLYPTKAFEWENLLPCCRKCNDAKGTLDTMVDTIINPCIENPKDYLGFESLFLISLDDSIDKEKANRTIKKLKLNSSRLLRARASVLSQLSEYLYELEEWIEEIENTPSNTIRRNKILKMRNSLESIETLMNPTEKYSFFATCNIKNRSIYIKALKYTEELSQT